MSLQGAPKSLQGGPVSLQGAHMSSRTGQVEEAANLDDVCQGSGHLWRLTPGRLLQCTETSQTRYGQRPLA